MKKTFVVALLLSLSFCGEAQVHNWASLIGGYPDKNQQTGEPGGKVSTMDAFGHLYVTTENGSLRKFDLNGQQIWQTNIGKTGYSIAADLFGYIYIVGIDGDAFVEKRDAAGNFIWTKYFEGADFGIDIAVDAQANIYAVGHFRDPTDFDPGINTHFEDTGGAYVVKLDSGGNFLWVYTETEYQTNREYYNAVSLDASGNAYLGAVAGIAGFQSGYIEKVSADGALVWKYNYPVNGILGEDVLGIKVTDSNYVYATGLIDYKPGQNGKLFVQKLDTSGNQIWMKKFGHGAYSFEGGIDVDDDGNVYAIGSAGTSSGFSEGGPPIPSFGFPNMFLVKISPVGDTLWSVVHYMPLMSTNKSHGYNVAVDNCEIYLTGVVSGSVDVDDGNGTVMLTGGGLFLQKMLCNSLSVKELNNEDITAKIYPNPTSRTIHISSPDIIHSVQVTDVLGKIVCSKNIEDKATKVELDAPDGVYYVSTCTDKGMYTKKVVVRN